MVIFVGSVSRCFGPSPSSVEFKYVRIVAMFAYAMKENIKKKKENLCSARSKRAQSALKVQQVGNVLAPWLPGKSSLDKVL